MSFLETDSSPLPLEPLPETQTEDRRLWIGNIDPRVTEFQLVTMLQRHGALERFDLLFHRTGPMAGRPRGYAFATFSASSAAEAARARLDGANIGGRRLAVRWANAVADEDGGRAKPELSIAALSGAASAAGQRDPAAQIRLLEAKLRSMKRPAEDFAPTDRPSLGGPSPYPYAAAAAATAAALAARAHHRTYRTNRGTRK